MNDIRQTFLDGVPTVLRLLRSPEAESRWTDPSSLPGFTTGGLAGHLTRAVSTVETYLNEPVTANGERLSAADYFAAALQSDPSAPINIGVRERGEALGQQGPASLGTLVESLGERLAVRLRDEPEDRVLQVRGGIVMELDEYLLTRILEIVVHSDDLAVSLDLPTPSMPEAEAATIAVLINIARVRHGDLEVIRSLTRRERARPGIFPVI